MSDLWGSEFHTKLESDCSESEGFSDPEIEEYESDTLSDNGEYSDTFIDKNGFQWNSQPLDKARDKSHVLKKGGLTSYSNDITEIVDSFRLFINQQIIDILIRETNRKGNDTIGDKWTDVDSVEINAFIGLLLASGSMRVNDYSISDLWSQDDPFHISIFSGTMARDRFKDILRYIRFDDIKTRSERRESDKLTAIREINDIFVNNCVKMYIPGPFLTIDEQLLEFSENYPFIVNMKDKPEKHGIKLWVMCDVKNHYVVNFRIYTGKEQRDRNGVGGHGEERHDMEKRVVMDLTSALSSGHCHGITMNNFFTSVELAQELLNHNLTIVGTMRRNNSHVPSVLLPSKTRAEHSSIFAFRDNMTLVSYVPKKSNAIILLSTEHHSPTITEYDKKPEILLAYNKRKGSVNTLDQMVKEFTCRRSTRRWTFSLFANFIDIAALNAYALWNLKFPQWENKSNRRFLFLKELTRQLVTPYVHRRSLNVKGIQSKIIADMSKIIPISSISSQSCVHESINGLSSSSSGSSKEASRSRCYMCFPGKRKCSRNKCQNCNKFVCLEHASKVLTILYSSQSVEPTPEKTMDRCHMCVGRKRKMSRSKCDKCKRFSCSDHTTTIKLCNHCNDYH